MDGSGEVFSVAAPFVRDLFCDYANDTFSPTWRPGVEHRLVMPDSSETYSNGVGSMVLSVVSIHKPGRFPTRVFYTREWIDPDGRRFGKPKLMTTTLGRFRSLCRGWSVDFVLDPAETQHCPALPTTTGDSNG
jgi:hypothetical protein